MNTQLSSPNGVTASPKLAASTVAPVYQAPAIESVVTFDNLQREVFYAGGGAPMTNNPPVP